jgi:integrase
MYTAPRYARTGRLRRTSARTSDRRTEEKKTAIERRTLWACSESKASFGLKSSETKTDKGRLIPLNQTLTSALKTATRYVRCPWVFVSQTMVDLWQADPKQVDPHYHATSITHAFERACHTSGVSHATFHDLRHIFVTNARCAGIDYFRIMAITGHKMTAVFKRYNSIDQRDLHGASVD